MNEPVTPGPPLVGPNIVSDHLANKRACAHGRRLSLSRRCRTAQPAGRHVQQGPLWSRGYCAAAAVGVPSTEGWWCLSDASRIAWKGAALARAPVAVRTSPANSIHNKVIRSDAVRHHPTTCQKAGAIGAPKTNVTEGTHGKGQGY